MALLPQAKAKYSRISGYSGGCTSRYSGCGGCARFGGATRAFKGCCGRLGQRSEHGARARRACSSKKEDAAAALGALQGVSDAPRLESDRAWPGVDGGVVAGFSACIERRPDLAAGRMAVGNRACCAAPHFPG